MADLFVLPNAVPLSSSASLLAGAKLYFYATASSTPKSVYQDRALSNPHSQPVVADANGVFAPIWYNVDAKYRMILKTSADVTLQTVDDLGPQNATDLLAPTLAASNVFTGTNKFSAAEMRILMDETDAGTDKRLWDIDIQSGVLKLRTRTDADGSGVDILTVTRGTTTAVTGVALGAGIPLTFNGSASAFAPTFVGFSANPSFNNWQYVVSGGIAVLQISMTTGTSNSTGFSITGIPAAITPVRTQSVCVPRLVDNGVTLSTGMAIIANDSTITFLRDHAGTNWTASGNKGSVSATVYLTITYAIV